jgi:secondary thiamine-phosphate synthase enzyme
MKVYHDKFQVQTSKRVEVIDITEKIKDIANKSKIENGICLIFVPHATASIILEEAESGLIKDIEKTIQKMFPRGSDYEHDRIDDNASSHLASGFIGQSRTYPIKNGEIVRGTWQQSLLLELDGPRNREVIVTVLGE